MKISDRVSLDPNLSTGGWTVTFDEDLIHFINLSDAIETVLELSLVIAIDDAEKAKETEHGALMVQDAVEAFREMIMTWFQTQIPDPHAVTDINRI